MREFQPVEMAAAIKQSRELLPHALDALCAVITEVTGQVPNRTQVEYVSLFWLIHACDKVTIQNMDSNCVVGNVGASLLRESYSLRSYLLSAIGKRTNVIQIFHPYLKSGAPNQIQAAIKARRALRWSEIRPPKFIAPAINLKLRSKVASEVSFADPLRDAIWSSVAQSSPSFLVEQFLELGHWAAETADRNARLVYTANAHQSSALFRHLAWAQRQVGTKIAIHQHGGGYGIDEQHLGEDHDVALSDVFYTFGWQRPDLGRRVRSLPTAMPERAKGSKPHGYLLVSLPILAHVYRLQAFLMPAHIEHAVSETISFVNELVADTDLCVRSSGSDVFPMSRLVGAQAKITHDAGSGRGSVAASRAKLTIHNYLGTSWLETLAMNIPTVCFYDPTMYRPRAAAQPFVDALVRVGVVHYSGREAAKFVNSLHGDPSSWWGSSEVQEAREAFVARYANFSDNWLDAWQAEFESLLAE